MEKNANSPESKPGGHESKDFNSVAAKTPLKWYQFETKLKPGHIAVFIMIHVLGMSSFYFYKWRFDIQTFRLYFFQQAFEYFFTSLGVTAGCHRLWSHRSYKAKTAWRVFLMISFMAAGQSRISYWAYAHRLHHKYSETNADPHNVKRGFFFAHCGWLLMKSHPDVYEKSKGIDMSDVLNDPVVVFSNRYYWYLKALFAFGLPMAIPMICWGEEFWNVFMFRMLVWVISLHHTFIVNSVAHLWGPKPYDKNINPVDNMLIAITTVGEGYHNFHHAIPWDYRTTETTFYFFHITTLAIDLAAKFGLVSGRKVASRELIYKKVLNCGDGSRKLNEHQHDLVKNHLKHG